MFLKVVILLLTIVSFALGYPELPEPIYKPEILPYFFNYDVNDDYKGANYGQQERSDGKAVQGSYTVALPDGRRQLVEYTADHQRGYVARVSYVGKAKHPQYYGKAVTFPAPKGYQDDRLVGQGLGY